jgi:hypothetical protein
MQEFVGSFWCVVRTSLLRPRWETLASRYLVLVVDRHDSTEYEEWILLDMRVRCRMGSNGNLEWSACSLSGSCTFSQQQLKPVRGLIFSDTDNSMEYEQRWTHPLTRSGSLSEMRTRLNVPEVWDPSMRINRLDTKEEVPLGAIRTIRTDFIGAQSWDQNTQILTYGRRGIDVGWVLFPDQIANDVLMLSAEWQERAAAELYSQFQATDVAELIFEFLNHQLQEEEDEDEQS